MTNLQSLGGIIRAERERRGLSQEALADLSGLSRTHIGEIERGEVNVSFTALEATIGGLGILLVDFMELYEQRAK
jgi:transcriptional regulator with XRE-family HTH domain